MVSYEDLKKAKISDLTIRQRVEAFYLGTKAWAEFAEKSIIPILKGLINLNDKETAIVGTYYRIYFWIQSMVIMNRRMDYQGAASAARSLFELLLDIKILAADKIGNMVEKFHVFPELEKFRVADKIVSFRNKYKGKIKINVFHQRKLVIKPNKRQTIEQIILKHWGKTKKGKPNWPDHWTGKKILERAQALGFEYEEMYIDVYPMLSWHSHTHFEQFGVEN